MKPFKSSRYMDKRDEILITLVAAFVPMASLAGMVY